MEEKVSDGADDDIIEYLFSGSKKEHHNDILSEKINKLYNEARKSDKRQTPILSLFSYILRLREENGLSPVSFCLSKEMLIEIAQKHKLIDEHGVSVSGRILKASEIVKKANMRVSSYIENKDKEAPSGIELWDKIQKNKERIKSTLGMDEDEWNTYEGQLAYAIDSVDVLSEILYLPEEALDDIRRVTKHYRMRLTPYYASLIMPGKINDPVLLQSVPTGEMIDNAGPEIEPVAADHSPARLIDQLYPRTVALKATNMCAMFCTHCLRISHIGKRDRIYSKEAYEEAIEYIRDNRMIRDVLITGGDALVLPDNTIEGILSELDDINHVKVKRLGSRIPVTCPYRIDEKLLSILRKSNSKKPLRLSIQVNNVQEITPVSKEIFRRISNNVSAILNQTVLLKGVNDSKNKMWKLCELLHESYVRPYYVFNCSYRN
ncbi:MAG: KamA family radical SAM protein, partial [Candidatus Micrarchaeota archaeon]|nr:KamA family radical SAM protein [Candidatus Micrarchaeota archaeon]